MKVRGPYHRPATDEHGYVRHVRRYYRITYPDPLASTGRGYAELKTKELALKEARRIDGNLAAGLPPMGPVNDGKTLSEVIDAYLDPANHRAWTATRSQEAPASFLNTWVRPVMGHLPVREWQPDHTEFILKAMDVAKMKLSYRAQGFTYLSALATFAKKRTQGYLHPHADPLADVERPKQSSEPVFVKPDTLPDFADVRAFGASLGAVVHERALRGKQRRDGSYSPADLTRADLEQLRWSMLPIIVAYFGVRLNEALALRTTDFLLNNRDEGLGLRIERQAERGSTTKTIPPKHGSTRTTYATDEVWDDVVEMLTRLERAHGQGCLLWSQQHDPGRRVSDDTLYTSYFKPAAEATPGWTYTEVGVYAVAEDETGELIAVPSLKADGTPRTRRAWTWSWRHLRHLYGTTALANTGNGGWGQDISDVSEWMGHKTAEVTWKYYIGKRKGGGGRMAAATGATPVNTDDTTPPATAEAQGTGCASGTGQDTPVQSRGPRAHLRLVV